MSSAEPQLYTRTVSPGGRASYQPYTQPPIQLSDDMTEEQLISAVGSLAVMAIHGYQALLPEHKRVAKKAQKVRDAVLDMYAGCGAAIDDEILDFVGAAWGGTMRKLAAIDGEYCSRMKELEQALKAIYTEAMIRNQYPDNDQALDPAKIMQRCAEALGV
jgi:hypothetical protein